MLVKKIAIATITDIVNYETIDCEPTSIFEVASLTKVVFAYLVIKLSQDGLFDLNRKLYTYNDDITVGKYKINEFVGYKNITALHVLSHSSGLKNWPSENEKRLYFTPGTAYMYSGFGYYYLQKIVEKVMRQSIEGLFSTYVFEPFKMKRSFLKYNDVVKCHLVDSFTKEELNDYTPMDSPCVAYTLYTTIVDYANFIVNLLKSPVYKEMNLTLTEVIDDMFYGLGLLYLDDDTRFQWGDNGCFKAMLVTNRIKSVVIFTNFFDGLEYAFNYLKSINYPNSNKIKRFLISEYR